MKQKMSFVKKAVASTISLAMCLSFAIPASISASAATTNLVDNSGFEDGTTTGWAARGTSEKLTVSTATANTGKYSCLVTGRQDTWNGPSCNLLGKLKLGKTYDISVYVKAKAGQSSSHNEKVTLSMQRTDADGTHYDNIQSGISINENSWTKLSGQYTLSYSGDLTDIDAYIESPDATLDFYVDDLTVSEVSMDPQTDLPSLCQIYKNDFDLGVAIDPVSQLDSSDPHSQLISWHFNSLTAGNAMKVSSLQPTEGNFNFTQADKIVDYAIAHNMKIRGHNLLWHNQVPDWFFTNPNDPSKPATREQLLARLKTHITTVLKHFKDKYGSKNPIYCWDVCNEVISDCHANNGLRGSSENSKWLDIIGPDYIEKAFEYAHEADPNVQLYINDYNLEDNNQKTTDMYNEVKKLLSEGTPIDGIGIQMHILNSYPSVADVKASIEKLASLGVKLQITEMDCSTQGAADTAALQTQADKYKALFELFVSEKQYINSVTLWGVSDDTSWLGASNAPLLFDGQLKAKPAYYAVANVNVLNSEISPESAEFDKNSNKQSDISVKISANGNTLNGIYNGTTQLVKGTDYTLSADGSTATILKSYLSTLSVGTATFKFDFDKGTDPTLTVSIIDSTNGGSVQTGSLKVEMTNAITAASSNTIALRLKITNTSNSPIDLSSLKIRYYYTKDSTQPQNFWCDWSNAGTTNVTGTFNSISAKNADNYLEIGFKAGTGSVAPGDVVYVQTRVARNDWTNYDQSNDYSFNPSSNSNYTEWSKITAYIGNTLVWGVEPSAD